MITSYETKGIVLIALKKGKNLSPYKVDRQYAEEYVLQFGKYKGKTLGELLETDVNYLYWLCQKPLYGYLYQSMLTLGEDIVKERRRQKEDEQQNKELYESCIFEALD